MLVTLLPMVMEVRAVQFAKAHSPILATPFPIVTEVRPEQPEKASLSMLVTLLGMVTEVRLEQLEKVPAPMLVCLPFLKPAKVQIKKKATKPFAKDFVALLMLTINSSELSRGGL